MATGYDLTDSYTNSKCVSNLLDTNNWGSFIGESGKDYGDFAIGGPIPTTSLK